MIRFSTLFLLTFLVLANPLYAADFYINPATGDDANDGSINRPWRSLDHVFQDGLVASRQWESLPYKEGAALVEKNPNGPIRPGDTIWLSSEDYGDLVITDYYNSDFVTIAAKEGETPRFRRIQIRSGSHWVLKGLHVSPEFGEGKRPRDMISVESHGFRGPVSDVVVDGCVLASAEDTSQWSKEDWNRLACSGISADGTKIIIRGNRLKNVNFGISVDASHSLIEHNTIENFAGDGLRGLGNHSVFQYNLVKNCYDVNQNHDDGFQSWSHTRDGVGKGEVVGIVLRGNTIINYEDPNQPHRGTLQGIGCFDGMFVDWVVENNVILIDHWHGITLSGARNCRIVNNTVMDLNADRPGPPWIRIGKHKNGTPSCDCVIRNNLTTSLSVSEGEGMVEDHNVIIKEPETLFEDVSRHDLRLKKGGRAIDAGANELAPDRDIVGTKRPQGKAVDVGAYERVE